MIYFDSGIAIPQRVIANRACIADIFSEKSYLIEHIIYPLSFLADWSTNAYYSNGELIRDVAYAANLELANTSFEKHFHNTQTAYDKNDLLLRQSISPVSKALKQFDEKIQQIEKTGGGIQEKKHPQKLGKK